MTHAHAVVQWAALYQFLIDTLSAAVFLVPPQPGLPDMTFTANAGLVRRDTFIPSRFRHAERQGEEPHFTAWFAEQGYEIVSLPEGMVFEGAGDALFDEREPSLLWAAYGPRTDREAHAFLAKALDVEVVSLGLKDPRYYHLDTCFCPLPGGHLLWYPPAFDKESQDKIEDRVPEARRFTVSDQDAAAFACNAVAIGGSIVMNAASNDLVGWLGWRGFAVHTSPLSEFLRAGGAARCLSLRIS